MSLEEQVQLLRQEPNAKASRVQGNRERSIAALNATGFLLAGLYSMRTGGYSFTTTNERYGAAPLRQPDGIQTDSNCDTTESNAG